MDYLVDGSLHSLFSLLDCIGEAGTGERHICQSDHYQMSLLTPFTVHKTDQQRAQHFFKNLDNTLGERIVRSVLTAYLSDDPGRFDAIDRFLQQARRDGKKVYHQINHQVTPLLTLERAVERERHRFLGLLRFKRLKGDIYYAAFEPTYDLCVLLVDHFAERMKQEYFIIHDIKRQKAVFYNKKTWATSDLAQVDEQYHQEELAFQSFWKKYHRQIAIAEGKNLSLQRSFMPKKYWNYLPEMDRSEALTTEGLPILTDIR